MAEEKQWEYLSLTLGSFLSFWKDEQITEKLNELGEQGWEVVNVYLLENTRKSRVIAKRPLTTTVRRQRSLPGY